MTSLADKSLLSGGSKQTSRPLVWPSIIEDGVTRLKEYVELTPAEAIQADCDIKAINIILQGLPTEIYALCLWSSFKVNTKFFNSTHPEELEQICYCCSNCQDCFMANLPRKAHDDSLRGQSAQTVHMMTKSKICYDHSSKQAIGFEKPFYLKKARESKPKLYDGNTILKMDTIVIPDSDETLELSEESPLDPSHSSTTVIVEVPKELPTVSMVNTSLKELKRYLTGFDQVVKERTTATAITEGTWGFEHTKACFRDEIIPFIKELKDIFNNFNQYLVEELADVQKVFYQMEQAVEQHRLESRTFEVKMNQVLSENERLLAQAIDKDIVKTVVNLSVNASGETVNECQKCLELKTELLNKKDFVDKETYDKLCKCFTTLEKHCITLEADSQLNQEIFQQENSVLNQNAPSFTQLFELSELRAQSQAKDTVIVKLKEQIKSLNGNVDENTVKMDMDEIETLNIELEHRVTKLVTEKDIWKPT
ncbi:hypothetical protein Tco_0072414 [Tanacetum coccineum]